MAVASISVQVQNIVDKFSRIRQKDRTWVFQGKWLRAGTVSYTRPDGEERVWETTERTTRTGPVDGVDIVASSNFKEISLVVIYRPSVNKVSVEFPAGLVSEGESVEAAALRELKEETGLVGTVEKCGVEVHSDPWKSNENSIVCQVRVIDNDRAENSKVLNLDEDEILEPIQLPLSNLLEQLEWLKQTYDFVIEAKLYMFALGLSMGSIVMQAT